MGLKEFLKPDKLKVMYALGLLILNALLFFIVIVLVPYTFIPFIPLNILGFFYDFFYYPNDYPDCRFPFCGVFLIIFSILSSLIIYYLLACIIAYAKPKK